MRQQMCKSVQIYCFLMERRTDLARLALRKQCFWPDSGSRDYFVMIDNIFRLVYVVNFPELSGRV